MYDFDYHRPATLDAAAALISADDDFKLLAGGMSLIPSLKLRLARYSGLVDLGAVASLNGIRRDGNAVVIGAMTPHATVAASREVASAIPALATLAGGIGDPLVRNRGTIGGSIANADPAADYPAGVVGLGATVWTNKRKIASDEFFSGLFETALEPGEIITAVSFPIPEEPGYAKLRHPASRFAIVGRVRGEDGRRRTGCGDRSRAFGLSGARGGSSPDRALRARGPRRYRNKGRRPELRHTRERRVPRAQRWRDGQTRCVGGALEMQMRTRNAIGNEPECL